MFVTEGEAASPDYRAFWARLARGEYQAGEFKRRAKDGAEIWIQATYNPILDAAGRTLKIVKYATDITAPSSTRPTPPARSRRRSARRR